jgi:hypothetical protein
MTIRAKIAVQRVAKSDRRWKRVQGQTFARRDKMLAELRQMHRDGKRIKDYVRFLLDHHDMRLSAALKVLGEDPDEQEAKDLARRINAWQAEYPAIRWSKKAKSKGGYRPICRLPRELKAVHYMVADILKALFDPAPYMFGVNGEERSRDDAASRLKSLQNNGYTSLAKLDIVNCFQSIDPERLINFPFPLPKEVMRRSFDTRHMAFEEMDPQNDLTSNPCRPGYPIHAERTNGPRGLLPGSPASNIMLAWLLNQIVLPGDGHLILAWDNFAVAAKDDTTCQATVLSLIAYFERDCPAGPLALCDTIYAAPGTDPLTFLGYEFDVEKLEPGISEDAIHKLEGRLNQIEEMDFDEELHRAIAFWQTLRPFRDGFPAADAETILWKYVENTAVPFDAMLDPFLANLHRHVFAPATTPEGAVVKALCALRKPVTKARSNRSIQPVAKS